jgi:CRP-like cAMP-binding protein
MNNTEFLSKVSLFSLIKKPDLERVARLASRHLFQRGDVIIREGDPGGRLFIVVSGQVNIMKELGGRRERRVRTLGPYDYFGEMALIDDLVRSASVVAIEPTQVLSLDRGTLRQEIERYPNMAFELLQMLSRRIRAIEKTMMNTLGTLLPICAQCKKIREANSTWKTIEEYISDHSETEVSHGLCPECARELYPELYRE